MPSLPSHEALLSTSQNTTTLGLHVVCAWPVSGQYGPGSRSLYYALVAVCVFARKAIWLRKACLAAALLFPAVAALHGIALAAVHVDGATDMDVYGSFQLCAIGILAAPVTVRLSGTYLKDPGRNIIYVWTLLVLAGLLSLVVEFIRIDSIPCTYDDFNHTISSNAKNFPYGNATCGVPCYIDSGPFGQGYSSPLRHGSANNIYIIPEPDKLTPNTATLIAAGCCLPAILSLISMWNKILEYNWKTRNEEEVEKLENEFITGTNGATIKEMKSLNGYLRKFLNAVEIPVFGAAVLAILVLGERNFFSHQVDYQTEPIASIGQWAPIVGTGLALLGSLYILLMHRPDEAKENKNEVGFTHHCNCSSHGTHSRRSTDSSTSIALVTTPTTQTASKTETKEPNKPSSKSEEHQNIGYRTRVAETLSAVGSWFGTASDSTYDDSTFRRGRADDYPLIPGEFARNDKLKHTQDTYNKPRDANGNVTPRAGSPHSQVQRRRAMTLDVPGSRRGSFEERGIGGGSGEGNGKKRSFTLEVPSPVYHGLGTGSGAERSPSISMEHLPSPTIVISSNDDEPMVEYKEYVPANQSSRGPNEK